MRLVLINSTGCEIDNQKVTKSNTIEKIVSDWILEIGDTIKIVKG